MFDKTHWAKRRLNTKEPQWPEGHIHLRITVTTAVIGTKIPLSTIQRTSHRTIMTLMIRAHISLAHWAALKAQVQVLHATITNLTAPGLRASL